MVPFKITLSDPLLKKEVNFQLISNKNHIILRVIPLVCCRTTLQKLEVSIYGNLQKNLKIVSRMTKTETYLVIWLNIVTLMVRLLPAYMREDVHATHQLLHCQ